jgi:hypothetical protein
MKFSEMPKAALESVGRFTQEQLAARERRLSDPALQTNLERMKTLTGEDFKRACGNGFTAACRLTVGAPLSALWEGMREFGSVVGHNFSESDPKKKRSYSEIPAAALKELFVQYGKGAIDAGKMAGNLSLALTRSSVLGTRYLIGK